MVALLGEMIGSFLVCLIVAYIWFGATWRFNYFKSRQLESHGVAFVMAIAVLYASAVGAGGLSVAHFGALILLSVFIAVRARRYIKPK